jgi:hypothetical protein
MRTLLVLVCSFALAFAATGTQQEKKKEAKPAPKKPAQATQVAKPKAGGPKAGAPQHQTNASQTGPGTAKGKGKRSQQTNAAAGQPVSGGPQKTKERKPRNRLLLRLADRHKARQNKVKPMLSRQNRSQLSRTTSMFQNNRIPPRPHL